METLLQGKTQRISNLELYRIIAMFLIVAHHYVVNSGLWEVMSVNPPMSGKNIFYYVFGAWGKTCINCFVLITGYFMYKKNITVHKFAKLILQILFYNIILYIIFWVTGYHKFNILELIYSILPVKSVSTGFISSFILFYLTIPFLNISIRNMNKKQHGYLIVLFLFVYTFLGSIPKINVAMNYVSWFIVLYFISSFIGKYGLFNSVSHRRWGGLPFFLYLYQYLA